jgi:hypothetical protein
MIEMKRFPVLITDGKIILVKSVWHDSAIEAKKFLTKNLSPIYSIVEDASVIENFINK